MAAGPASAQWVSAKGNLPAGTGSFMTMDAIDEIVAVCSGRLVSGSLQDVFMTTDGGTTWNCIHTAPASSEGIICITLSDANHIWCASSTGKIYGTSDGGTTWVKQFDDPTKTTYMNYIKMFDASHGIAMGDNPVKTNPALFLKTTDGGTTWLSMNTTSFGGVSSNNFYSLCFLDTVTGYFYAWDGTNYRLMKTTNAGVGWSELARPTMGGIYGITFYNVFIGICSPASATPQSISRTLDGGVTWETNPSIHTGVASEFDFVPGDPSKVWMADYSKLYFSADTGRTWTLQMSTKIRQIVWKTASIGWMCGAGEFVYRTINGGMPTSGVRTHTQPLEYSVDQNYPNPFNPKTVINYHLANRGRVILSVHDLLGREVALLVDEINDAGSYSVTFDGSRISSGIYFTRLSIQPIDQIAPFIQTIKVVLVK